MALPTPETVYRRYETDGVPDSGDHKPIKAEIIQLLNMLFGTSRGGWVVARTLAELNGITPESETDGGVVLTGTGAGYYDRNAGVWVFGRGFPDTFAKVTLSGSGTAQTGTVNAGVNPASIEVFFAKVVTANTGAMTLSISGEAAKPVVNLAGNPLSAGEWTGMVMFYVNEDGQYQLLTSAGAEQAAAASASFADERADDAEDAATRAENAAASFSEVGTNFKTVANLLADTTLGYAGSGADVEVAEGDIVTAGGWRYEVPAEGAPDGHIETAGGLSLYILPLSTGEVSLSQFGIVTMGIEGAAAHFKAAYPSIFPNGGTLIIPAGDWVVSSATVMLDLPGLEVRGAAFAGTRILNALESEAAMQIGAEGIWRLKATNLTFGGAAGLASLASVGLVMKGSDIRLTNVEAYPYPAPLHYGVVVEEAYLVTVDRVITSGCIDAGQTYRDVASINFIEASSLVNGNRGFLMAGVEGAWGGNVHAYGNENNAFAWVSHVSRPNKNNFLNTWVGDTSGADNWFVLDLQSSILTNCWGADQLLEEENTGANGFLLGSNKVKNLQFMGGRAGSNNGNGVTLYNDGSGAPSDIEFHNFDFGSDLADLPSNGRGGVGYGLGADASCTGIKVFGGKNIGNPSGAFSPSGIEIIEGVSGYVNSVVSEFSGATDANGDVTFDPGMDENPYTVNFHFSGGYRLSAQVISAASNSIVAKIFGPTGDPVVSSPVGFKYEAVAATAVL